MTALARPAYDPPAPEPAGPSVPRLRVRIPRRVLALAAGLFVTCAAFGIGFVIADSPVRGVVAVLGVVAFLVSLAKPSSATYVVIAILYSNAAAVAVRAHDLPAFVAIAFPLLLALPLGDQLFLQRKPVVVTSALPFLFGYLLVEVLGAIGARDVSDTTDSLIGFLISGIGLYFVMTNVIRTYSALRTAIWTVLIVAAAIGLITTIQAVTGSYNNTFGGFATVDVPGKDTAGEQLLASVTGTPRAEGPIGETNRFGQVMLVLLPIGALLALGEKRRLLRWGALFLTLLILLGMSTTFSRGAAVGLVVVVIVAAFFGYVKLRHLAAVGLVIAVVLVAFPRYGERLIDLQGLLSLDQTRVQAEEATNQVGDTGNLRGRATSTLAALYVWSDHPVFGVGRGQFQTYYEEYAGLVADTGINARVDFGESRQAHNLYTSVAAETGTLGLLCFLAVFVVTIRNLYRARRWWLASRPEVAHLAMGFLLALVGYLVSGIALHLSYERYLWFLLALAGIAAHLALRGDPERDFEVPGYARRAVLAGATSSPR
jgi:putative inorganic carbon (hco3(-)) transporter